MKAARLAEIRILRCLTQKTIADALGVTQAIISQLERGRKVARPEQVEKLAVALSCTVADLEAAPGSPITPASVRPAAVNAKPLMVPREADD